MVMGMESSYINFQRISIWLTEGLCANDWRIDNKPSGHELAARPPHSREKTKCYFLGFGTSLYGTSRSTKPNHWTPTMCPPIYLRDFGFHDIVLNSRLTCKNHLFKSQNLMVLFLGIITLILFFFVYRNQILCVWEIFIYTRVLK